MGPNIAQLSFYRHIAHFWPSDPLNRETRLVQYTTHVPCGHVEQIWCMCKQRPFLTVLVHTWQLVMPDIFASTSLPLCEIDYGGLGD